LKVRLALHFPRSDLRQRAQTYFAGLLGESKRKNGWQLAGAAADSTPYGLQHLLGRANRMPTLYAVICAATAYFSVVDPGAPAGA
jgi:hypothetical protein